MQRYLLGHTVTCRGWILILLYIGYHSKKDVHMSGKSTEEEHITHLHKLFERLKKFTLRLNPNKCTFGVRSGKLLGFIVSQRGIKVDPDKVKAIQEMPVPKTEKEVRGFVGSWVD